MSGNCRVLGLSSVPELRVRGKKRREKKGEGERERDWMVSRGQGRTIGLVKAICHSEILQKLVSGSAQSHLEGDQQLKSAHCSQPFQTVWEVSSNQVHVSLFSPAPFPCWYWIGRLIWFSMIPLDVFLIMSHDWQYTSLKLLWIRLEGCNESRKQRKRERFGQKATEKGWISRNCDWQPRWSLNLSRKRCPHWQSELSR